MDEELAGMSDEIRTEAQFIVSHSPSPHDMGPIGARLTAIADRLLAKSGFRKDEPKVDEAAGHFPSGESAPAAEEAAS